MKAAKTRALHPKAKPAAKAAKAKHAAKAKKTAKKPAPHHHPAPHHPLTAHQLHLQHLKHLRGWSPGDVAWCVAEALRDSLRLSGRSVTDDDALDLFWHAGGDAAAGTSILAALGAASEFTLAGCRPVFEEVIPRGTAFDLCRSDWCCCRLRSDAADLPGVTRAGQLGGGCAESPYEISAIGTPLILGLELPGPHAVLATADGWWSWGELHDPAEWPDAVIEEAWAVTWEPGELASGR